MPSIVHRLLGRLCSASLVMGLLLSACASGPRLVDHAFGFDARIDSPNALILSYRYGTTERAASSSASGVRQYGRSPQWDNINGGMPLGETLYVKWQDKTSGQTYEDTVDLKPLLPARMEHKRIYFVVQGAQLHVYLTDLKTPRPKDVAIVGPFRTQVYLTQRIYPTRLP